MALTYNDVVQNPTVRRAVESIIPELLTDVRFSSNLTDETILIDAKTITDLILNRGKDEKPNLKVEQALKFTRPTLVVNSKKFGRKVWAPYGEADPAAPAFWRRTVKFWVPASLVGLFLVGFAAGRWSKKGLPEPERVRGAFGRE